MAVGKCAYYEYFRATTVFVQRTKVQSRQVLNQFLEVPYIDINSYLRTGQSKGFEVERKTKLIKEVIAKSNGPPDNIKLFRSTDTNFINEVFGGIDNVREGQVVRLYGFTSTSAFRESAFQGKDVTLEVLVPVETPVAPIALLSAADAEDEWLIQDRTQYVVRSFKILPYNKIHMVLEVIKPRKRTKKGKQT